MDAVNSFNRELHSLHKVQLPVSRQKMASITKAAMRALKFYKHVVQSVEKFISKCAPEYKVPGLYVIDAIVRQSKHFYNEKDLYGPRFMRNVVPIFVSLSKCGPSDKPQIIRVLQLWKKTDVFPNILIQGLLSLVSDSENTTLIQEVKQTVDILVAEYNAKKSKLAEACPDGNPQLSGNGDLANSVNRLLSHMQQGASVAPSNQIDQLLELQRKISECSAPLMQGQMIEPDVLNQLLLLRTEITRRTEEASAKLSDVPCPHHEIIDPNLIKLMQRLVETLERTQALQEEINQQQQQSTLLQVSNPSNHSSIPQNILENRQNCKSSFAHENIDALRDCASSASSSSITSRHQGKFTPVNSLKRDKTEKVDRANPMEGKPLDSCKNTDVTLCLGSELQGLRPRRPHQVEEDHRQKRPRYDAIVADSEAASIPVSNKGSLASPSSGLLPGESQSSISDPLLSKAQSQTGSSQLLHETEQQRKRRRHRMGLPRLLPGKVGILSRTVFMGHLHKQMAEAKLRSLCEESGEGRVVECTFIPPRGCAFVSFETRRAAARAIRKLSECCVNGREIKVAWAPNQGVKSRPDNWRQIRWDVYEGCTYISIDEAKNMDQTQLESLLAGSGEVDGDSIQDEALREAMLKAMPAIIDASTNLSGIRNPKPDGTLLESVSLSKLIPSPILATTTGGTTPISSISSYALPCKF